MFTIFLAGMRYRRKLWRNHSAIAQVFELRRNSGDELELDDFQNSLGCLHEQLQSQQSFMARCKLREYENIHSIADVKTFDGVPGKRSATKLRSAGYVVIGEGAPVFYHRNANFSRVDLQSEGNLLYADRLRSKVSSSRLDRAYKSQRKSRRQ
jgi:hypothetical protein